MTKVARTRRRSSAGLALLLVVALSGAWGCQGFVGRLVVGEDLRTSVEKTRGEADEYFREANKALENHPDAPRLRAAGRDMRETLLAIGYLVDRLWPVEGNLEADEELLEEPLTSSGE